MRVIETCLDDLEKQGLISQNNKYPIQGHRMIAKVKPGSIWTAKDMSQFCVLNVITKDNQVWVSYQRLETPNQNYSCLEPAFLQRFTEYTNR
jgi:hypothetical protein